MESMLRDSMVRAMHSILSLPHPGYSPVLFSTDAQANTDPAPPVLGVAFVVT
jgi:hypothetical protein